MQLKMARRVTCEVKDGKKSDMCAVKDGEKSDM